MHMQYESKRHNQYFSTQIRWANGVDFGLYAGDCQRVKVPPLLLVTYFHSPNAL